ncbi:DNA replication terminus site-binding protein [Motiliproteus coralliicola]|uniref:DNA replication terminus site-binding protein n=2 Tax=Motiliproteus coralliicola TaxID=2283196 RepID=A0A369WXP0_9GAMM|nr:DNA replication terminus site-binding protein [Motiliproteus coralliicola]
MSPEPSYTHAELVEQFERLCDALSQLAQQLQVSELPLWVPLTEAERELTIDPRRKAIELYCDLWHQGDGDGRRTRSCHGLVAADPTLLQQAESVNQHKQALQRCLQGFKQQPGELLEPLNQRPNSLRQALDHKGLARLHLKQCYRLIPTCTRQPDWVGFNWYTSGRSIKRISAEQAQQKLARMGIDKPHIQLQLDKLATLDANTRLAQVQTQAPLMRANLRFAQPPMRQALNLSLPLLFAHDDSLPFPEHNDPSLVPKTERSRRQRSDCLIETEPFLPSLRIHRYC